MQAAVYESYGPPEVVHLCEVPIPVCKDDHVLVQIGASSVNSADVRTRALDVAGPLKVILRLVMGWKRPKQPILGTVFSGKVIAVGSLATDFQVGDRLFGCTPGLGFGCHAEYVAVPIKAAMAKCPVKASDAESVSLVFGGTTALFFEQSLIQDWVYITGVWSLGGGGLHGSTNCQTYGFSCDGLCERYAPRGRAFLGAGCIFILHQ